MISKKFGNFFVLVGLTFSSTIAFATPAQILIIRHGEKAGGIGLSPDGFKRSKLLVNYFKTNPEVIKFGMPVAIYAMKQDGPDGSIRPIQTVTPLAEALSMEVQAPFLRDDLKSVVDQILTAPQYNGKMVLICWEHKVIPDMAHLFGVNPRPNDWPKEDFDTVFEINFSGKKISSFKTFHENVM